MAAKRRTLTIRGREYPVLLPSIRDPRLHVAVVLLTLQALGQTVLDFRLSVAQILICLAAGALIEFGYEFGRNKVIMWPASGLLTGNSTAFILRVPGTFHGQWWSTRGWWIFAGVVAFSMISKYVIRYRGRHIFNPSNLGLVLAFVALGPAYTEPQDLWWIPMGQGIIVALLSVVLLGPTTLEFWTKTAILASLVFVCAGRFALMRLVAPLEQAGGGLRVLRAMGWSAPAVLGVSALLVTSLPLSAQLSLHSVIPAPELPDGTRPTLALTIGSANAQDIGSWAVNSARVALPPSGSGSPTSASARVWVVPPLPNVSVPDNVAAFDSKAAASATQMAHAVVLNLMIESEARRAHDPKLAADGAVGDALTECTDVIQADGSGKLVQKTYSFDRVELVLYLPKFSTQASRLVGVFLHGTTTLITRDSSGNVLSQQTLPYAKAWGLDQTYFGLIINDFTDLNRA